MYLRLYNNIEVSKKWIPLIFLIKFKDGEFTLDVNVSPNKKRWKDHLNNQSKLYMILKGQ